MRYPYFCVTNRGRGTDKEAIYQVYQSLKSLGHRCWVAIDRDIEGPYLTVWRFGEEHFGSDNSAGNRQQFVGSVIEASDDRIEGEIKKGP